MMGRKALGALGGCLARPCLKHRMCAQVIYFLFSSFFLLLLPSFFFYSFCSVHIPGNNRYGSQPIHLAATSGSEETVALLLTNGALPNTPNKRGSYPLHGAAMVGDVDAVIGKKF